MDSCVFCKIIKGEIPCYKIHENDTYIAFLDLSHFTEGHTLVVPKKHHQFVWDVDNICEYYAFAQEIVNHYRNKLGFKYVDSATFGRDVPHSHIHLVPHNGEGSEWEIALSGIGNLQKDRGRWLSKEEGLKVQRKFKC